MANYRAGDVIRLMRVSSGLSQEELSEGICSVETLSRIENRKHAVKVKTYRELMIKMEHNPMKNYAICDTKDMEIFETRSLLNNAAAKHDIEQMAYYLEILELRLEKTPRNCQYLERIQAIIAYEKKEIDGKEEIQRLERALAYTVPNYREHIANAKRDMIYPFAEAEIGILMNLANAYMSVGEFEESLCICDCAVKCLNKGYIEERTAMELEMLFKTNRLKVFEEQNLFEKALDDTEQMLERAIARGYAHVIPHLLINKVWIIREMNHGRETSQSVKNNKETLKMAYYFAMARNQRAAQDEIGNYYYDCFGEKP